RRGGDHTLIRMYLDDHFSGFTRLGLFDNKLIVSGLVYLFFISCFFTHYFIMDLIFTIIKVAYLSHCLLPSYCSWATCLSRQPKSGNLWHFFNEPLRFIVT